MHIDSYDFGRMVIDGKVYSSDLIVLPDRIIGNWWRKQGHSLSVKDLEEVAGQSLRLLIVGTGKYGKMEVPQETVLYLREQGVDVMARETDEACKLFNEQRDPSEVAAAFHLTC